MTIWYHLFKGILKYRGERMGVSEILAALADKNRRMILDKLKEGRITTGDLAQSLGVSPQSLSYHLAKLKKADLIRETKYKNFIYYELDLTILDEVILWLSGLKSNSEGSDSNENDENK